MLSQSNSSITKFIQLLGRYVTPTARYWADMILGGVNQDSSLRWLALAAIDLATAVQACTTNTQSTIQVRTDNFKRFYGDWEKDGIELRGLVGDDETGSHKRGISGSATRPTRSTNSGPLVDGNGEPVIFYHGTKDIIRLEELIKVADCTDRMMGSRPILTHNNLQGKSEFKLQCNLHCKYSAE